MRIEVAREAVAHARERGGTIYIWASEQGFTHVDVAPPNSIDDWQEHDVDGTTVCIANSLPEMTFWRIGYRRFPRKRLDVVSNMTSGGPDSGTTGIL